MNVKENIDVQFVDKVKKNSTKNIPLIYFCGFFTVFFVAFIFGIVFCRSTRDSVSEVMKNQIAEHFSGVFRGCETATDYCIVIITSAASDIRYLVLIFTAGFTYFCKYAAGVMVAARAFTFGYSLDFLLYSLKKKSLTLLHPGLSVAIFFICELLVTLLFIYISVKSVFFGDDFRRLRGRRSLMLKSPIIYRHIFLLLTTMGFTIIVNAGYCLLSSIF